MKIWVYFHLQNTSVFHFIPFLSLTSPSKHASLSPSCVWVKLLQVYIPNENIGPLEILIFLKRLGCFPNAIITYIILLPIRVWHQQRRFKIETQTTKIIDAYYNDNPKLSRFSTIALATILWRRMLIEILLKIL